MLKIECPMNRRDELKPLLDSMDSRDSGCDFDYVFAEQNDLPNRETDEVLTADLLRSNGFTVTVI